MGCSDPHHGAMPPELGGRVLGRAEGSRRVDPMSGGRAGRVRIGVGLALAPYVVLPACVPSAETQAPRQAGGTELRADTETGDVDGCDPYQCAPERERRAWRVVGLPFAASVGFCVHQGPFGSDSHDEVGNEYAWDMDVPLGTEVLAVDAGVVVDQYRPQGGGGCSQAFASAAHNVKIEHDDGTVAQYVHVESALPIGTRVEAGDVIARTAWNGFICTPHLHFGVYRSIHQLYDSPQRETIPVRFEGVRGLLGRGACWPVGHAGSPTGDQRTNGRASWTAVK